MKDKSILLIGAGVWGKKILLTLINEMDVKNISIIHRNIEDHYLLKTQFPNVTIASNFNEVDWKKHFDLAIVSTQVSSQFEILENLASRKIKTLVEKPFCSKVSDAQKIYADFKSTSTGLFVNNIYCHSPNFKLFKILFQKFFSNSGYVFSSRRWDFGSFPKDTNTLHHLLYHDLTILNELVGLEQLSAHAYFSFNNDQSQLALSDGFNRFFDLNASQISAEKVRFISVSNTDYCLNWNDLDPTTPLSLTKFDITSKTKQIVSPLDDQEYTEHHSALFKVIQYALDPRNDPNYDSVKTTLKVKKFIQEIENDTKILHYNTRV